MYLSSFQEHNICQLRSVLHRASVPGPACPAAEARGNVLKRGYPAPEMLTPWRENTDVSLDDTDEVDVRDVDQRAYPESPH